MKHKSLLSYLLYAFALLLFFVGLLNSARNDTDESETKSTLRPYYSLDDIQPPPKIETFKPVQWDHLIDPSLQGTPITYAEYNEHSYIITYSARLKSNNHVGDSWGYGVTYDGEYIPSGSVIEFKGTLPLTLKAYAKEFDSYTDYGSTRITVDSLDIGEKQKDEVTVTVRENKGRYSGNTAKWVFNITIERIS